MTKTAKQRSQGTASTDTQRRSAAPTQANSSATAPTAPILQRAEVRATLELPPLGARQLERLPGGDELLEGGGVGLRALELDEDDVLVGTAITDGSCDVMLFSSEGKAVRFKESDVRAMGRTARGVRGIKLGDGHTMISLIIPEEGGRVLTVSENGYGKRTDVTEFPTKGRGTMGVIAMQTSERNGRLVGATQVLAGDQLMLISNQGTLVRTRADEVSILGRNTQGVRVIRTKDGEHLVSVERIEEPDEDDLPVDDEGQGEES